MLVSESLLLHVLQVNRGFAFSLYYTSLNAAALLNGLLLDPFRVTLSHGLHWSSWGPNAVVNSGYRLYLALGESL